MKQATVNDVREHLPDLLREATAEQIVISRNGKPVGLLRGFATEDDWIDYLLETDPEILASVQRARTDIKAGKGIRLEELHSIDNATCASSSKPKRPQDVHVVRDASGGWCVRREGTSRRENLPTQNKAIQFARKIAQRAKSNLFVHAPDGQI
jgi:antitoxin (DNA-binding transcriptional repressor) of toxin-antitoxin stability system